MQFFFCLASLTPEAIDPGGHRRAPLQCLAARAGALGNSAMRLPMQGPLVALTLALALGLHMSDSVFHALGGSTSALPLSNAVLRGSTIARSCPGARKGSA